MARKLSKREYFLIGVLVVSAVMVLYFRDKGRLFGRGEESKQAWELPGDAPLVNMDRLISRAEEYDPRGRNLFQYYTPPRPAPKPVVRKPPPTPPPQPRPRPTLSPGTGSTQPTPTLRPPKIPFKYIGLLGPKDDKIAVLETNNELELRRIGEVVQKQFRLIDFKYESVVIGYVDDKFKGLTTELEQSR